MAYLYVGATRSLQAIAQGRADAAAMLLAAIEGYMYMVWMYKIIGGKEDHFSIFIMKSESQ